MEATDYLSRVVAFSALAVSAVALFLTFRKDAHRVSITKSQGKFDAVVLYISNDSSFSVGIWAVGFFTKNGVVEWVKSVGEYQSNKFVNYPVRVEARSTYSILVVAGRDVPRPSVPHGYCVQLESGRTFVLADTAPKSVALKIHLRSLLSRLSAGSYGIAKRQHDMEH